jgi:plasmid replication initiation protein
MATQQMQEQQEHYSQGNELVTGIYTMPLDCKRLLLVGLAKVRYKESRDQPLQFTITAKAWAQLFNVDQKSAYQQLRRAAHKLMRQYNPVKVAGIGSGPIDPEDYREKVWFDECHYCARQGYVELCFSDKIRPHITDLRSDFTLVDLNAVRGMTSVHSIRIYELLRQYRGTGWLSISLVDLRVLFQLENKYTEYFDFKRKVIDKAVKEINQRTNLQVAYEVKRTGRKVTDITFRFTERLSVV